MFSREGVWRSGQMIRLAGPSLDSIVLIEADKSDKSLKLTRPSPDAINAHRCSFSDSIGLLIDPSQQLQHDNVILQQPLFR